MLVTQTDFKYDLLQQHYIHNNVINSHLLLSEESTLTKEAFKIKVNLREKSEIIIIVIPFPTQCSYRDYTGFALSLSGCLYISVTPYQCTTYFFLS